MEAHPASCERTAQFVSLDLDGELSQFERVVLDRHLRNCQRCAADAQIIVELTERLRAAPVEQIHVSVVTRPRPRFARVVQGAVSVAAVAVVGVWLAVWLSGPARPTRPPSPPVTVNPGDASSAADGLYDWSAGLPRTPHMIQLVPGGLYTSSVGF